MNPNKMLPTTLSKKASRVSKHQLRGVNFFTGIYFFGLFGGFVLLVDSDGSGISLSPILYPILYFLTLVQLFFDWRGIRNSGLIPMLFMLFSGLIVSSLLCYHPVESLISVFSLGFNFLFAFWLTRQYDIKSFLDITLAVLIAVLLISILLAWISPNLVIYYDPADRASILGLPNIKGVFPHKIQAGIYSGFGCLLAFWKFKITNKKQFLVTSFMFAAMIAASGSSLAFTAFFIVIVITPLLIILKRLFGFISTAYLSGLLILFGVIFTAYDFLTPFLKLLGRDETLTGRTTIWDFGIDYIRNNPFWGGGFGVFFDPYVDAPAQRLWDIMRWYQAPSFHNGYIELAAEAGILGALSFFLMVAATAGRILSDNGFILKALVLLLLVTNFGAALLIKPNTFGFVFISFMFLKLFSKIETKENSLKK